MPAFEASLLLNILGTLVAVLVALAAQRIGSAQYALLAPRDAEAVPLFHSLALACGACTGLAFLLAAPHFAELAPDRLFAADAVWSVSLWDFLSRYALPSGQGIRGAGNALLGHGDEVQMIVGWLAIGMLASGLLLVLRWWQGIARIRAMLAFLAMAAWTALLLDYAINLLAWALAQLSFWTLLIALFAFQRWRYVGRSTH